MRQSNRMKRILSDGCEAPRHRDDAQSATTPFDVIETWR